MNRVFYSGRLSEKPKLMGPESNRWGLVKFWHKDGEDGEGNAILSYRTVYCKHPNTVQYLLDRGWDKGDEIFVEGAEKIVTNTKDGKTYVNVVVYDANVSCGLKKGDTLGNRNSQNQPANPEAPQPEAAAAQASPNTSDASEPRSMAELEEFDEEEIEF